MLISSHILVEMTDFCTSMAVMERGRLVVSGTIDEVRARLSQELVLNVEVIGGAEEFLRELRQDPLVGGIERRNGAFRVSYRGDRAQAADLLGTLVRAGVRVAAFAPVKEGLEELFQKIGAKELS